MIYLKIFEQASIDEIKILSEMQKYFSMLFLFHIYIKNKRQVRCC